MQDNLTKNTVELIKDQDAGKHKHHVIHRSQSFKEEWRSFEHTDGMGIKWDDYKYRHRQVLLSPSNLQRKAFKNIVRKIQNTDFQHFLLLPLPFRGKLSHLSKTFGFLHGTVVNGTTCDLVAPGLPFT